MDTVSRKIRSHIMSQIRSKWTSPERVIHNKLKGLKVRHKMHPKLPGNPDILLKDTRTAIFIDGCFWHGCPRCCREPKSNKEYWLPKIRRNRERDGESSRKARKAGFKVRRVWEHDIFKRK